MVKIFNITLKEWKLLEQTSLEQKSYGHNVNYKKWKFENKIKSFYAPKLYLS